MLRFWCPSSTGGSVHHAPENAGPFRNAINIGGNDSYYDIQVGEKFISQWREFKTGNNQTYNERADQLSEKIRSIFGFSRLVIDPSPDNQTLSLMIDGRNRKLHEVGSGIPQFIVALANAVMANPSCILIDEPESNLHPALQLDFLQTLGDFSNGNVFFATHSLGLARAASERIYTVRREPDEQFSRVVQYEKLHRLSEFVGELGFSSYQDLGFDKILLVEGATEVKTIQSFLRMYGKEHKILLLPLGGSQLIRDGVDLELEEVKRITPQVYALIDSEKAGAEASLSPDRAGFKALCDKMGISCHILMRRATEHYFKDAAIKKIAGTSFHELDPYEEFTGTTNWGKSRNSLIASSMTRADIEATDLGLFLESL